MSQPIRAFRLRWLLAAALQSLTIVAVAQANPAAVVGAVLAEPRNASIRLWGTRNWSQEIAAWYAARNYTPAWLQGTQLSSAGADLLRELRAAEARGLKSGDYRGNALATEVINLSRDATFDQRLALDVALTVRAARFLTDLHAGRISPANAGHDLEVPHAALDLRTALSALTTSRDMAAVLTDYEPPFHHYDLLKRALLRYRELALEPGLTDLPAPASRSVKQGEVYAGAAALRRLLVALGDLPATTPEIDRLDPALVAGIKAFQQRHGLAADGAIGSRTFAALTRPLSERVQQLEWAMERARWLPPRLGSPPLIVNIPQFKLFAFETTDDREERMLQMNVVVGKAFPSSSTPVFAADMRYLVLRPYWDVPASIVRRELLPKIRRDPQWIDRNGFELVQGQNDTSPVVAVTPENIEALAEGRLRIRQRPGLSNALGTAKFMFPNRYNVYLHGTPAQNLFAEASRAFSHGCVRVQDPIALAEFLLRDEPDWPRSRIEQALRTPVAQRINLRKPVRVFIFYATAIATESGQVLFFEDLYGHDRRLKALLERRQST